MHGKTIETVHAPSPHGDLRDRDIARKNENLHVFGHEVNFRSPDRLPELPRSEVLSAC